MEFKEEGEKVIIEFSRDEFVNTMKSGFDDDYEYIGNLQTLYNLALNIRRDIEKEDLINTFVEKYNLKYHYGITILNKPYTIEFIYGPDFENKIIIYKHQATSNGNKLMYEMKLTDLISVDVAKSIIEDLNKYF